MPRIRQTFTNRLPEPVVIWIEMNCHCFVLEPEESLTAEFDARVECEPLPLELSFDGEPGDRRPMLIFYDQGEVQASFFINDEEVVRKGYLTPNGRERFRP